MRVSARPVLERLQVIDSAIRRHQWPNARTLARELEVTPRTIQRDIAFLRYRLRAPINFDTSRNGFYYTDPSYRLPYFQMTQGELVALLVASQVMHQYRGTPSNATSTAPWRRSPSCSPTTSRSRSRS
jgi:predicted DNA-binding transcriptional regulator YafY